MTDPRVAAIIVTHNRAERLRRAIRSVRRQQPAAPALIVVDNGSTDHTAQVLQEECPDATVICLTRNTGCVVGSNIGAAAATQEVLFFLDDDSELAVDAVASATRLLLSDDRSGAVVATVIENGVPVRVTQTPAPTFINICHQGAFRREAFISAGMYPADFFYGAEEMDLSLRLLDAGYDIVFDPGTVVFHACEPQSRRVFGEVDVERNMLRVILMRAPLPLLVRWAGKKLWDTLSAALRTRRPGLLAAELVSLPRMVALSLRRRRPISWKVFAAWRYLSTREVTRRDYREAAVREYPGCFHLLRAYLQQR